MTMDVKRTPVYGTVLEKNPLPTTRTPFLTIPGQFRGQSAPLTLDKETLSKHTMLIGGTGCGKSNVFYHMINGIRRQMTPEDVMIVFDTKGDYYRLFARPGDVVIGGGRAFYAGSRICGSRICAISSYYRADNRKKTACDRSGQR